MGVPVRPLTEENKLDIRRLVSYDPESGKFFNKIDRQGVGRFRYMPAGSEIPASLNNSGYAMIGIANRFYSAHRIAWFLAHGEWPELNIDHVDHDRSNNKMENLRLVDLRGNKMNESLRKDNKSGCTGVCFIKKSGKWKAYYYANKKMVDLGMFVEKNDAIAARLAINMSAGFHPNHGKPKVKPGVSQDV